jgi:hypothetical protein
VTTAGQDKTKGRRHKEKGDHPAQRRHGLFLLPYSFFPS